ncbi:MAG: Gar1/Naf1 family protein [Candidatus Nitrosopolaris sp.]
MTIKVMNKELQEVGEVMHLAKSSRLIVRLLGSSSKDTRSGEILVDQNGRGVGKVVEIIGPVTSPYASVMPLTGRPNKVLGVKVFRGSLRSKRKK